MFFKQKFSWNFNNVDVTDASRSFQVISFQIYIIYIYIYIYQILHSKNITKIIKCRSDIWQLTASGMSKYYWKLVDNSAVHTIKFSIAKSVKGNTFINNCNLCLSKKAFYNQKRRWCKYFCKCFYFIPLLLCPSHFHRGLHLVPFWHKDTEGWYEWKEGSFLRCLVIPISIRTSISWNPSFQKTI